MSWHRWGQSRRAPVARWKVAAPSGHGDALSRLFPACWVWARCRCSPSPCGVQLSGSSALNAAPLVALVGSHPARARPAPLWQEPVLNANKMPFAKFSLGTSRRRDSCTGRGWHRGRGLSSVGAVGQPGRSVPRADSGGCVGSQRPPGCWWCSSGCVPEGCFPHVVRCAELNPHLFACGTASRSCAGAHVELGFYWHGAEQDAAPGRRMRPRSMLHCPWSPWCGCGWGPSSAAPGLQFISSAGLWGSWLRFLLLHFDAGGPVATEGRGPGLCLLPPFPWHWAPSGPRMGAAPGGREVQRGHSVGLPVMGDWSGRSGAEGTWGAGPGICTELEPGDVLGMQALRLGLCNMPAELGSRDITGYAS